MKIKIFKFDNKFYIGDFIVKNYLFKKEINNKIIKIDIVRYLSNVRQGTKNVKGRSEVKGSNRKIQRQKGSGLSRKGSIKNPIFRGGGKIFGPKQRKYNIKINRNIKMLSKSYIFLHKLQNNFVFVFNNFDISTYNTKLFLNYIKLYNVCTRSRILFLYNYKNINLYLSSRNISYITLSNFKNVSTYMLYTNKYIFCDITSFSYLVNNYLYKLI